MESCIVGQRVRVSCPDQMLYHGELGTVAELLGGGAAIVQMDRRSPRCVRDRPKTDRPRVMFFPHDLEPLPQP
jgi:hypothetical protein